MEKENNYSVNNPKISDWLIPVLGFINYTKRNQEEGACNTNNYANSFYHLLVAHITEILAMGILAKSGLESLIK